MNEQQIQVEKITLKIKDQRIDLTLNELITLKNIIDDLVNNNNTKEYIYYPPLNPPYPQYPFYCGPLNYDEILCTKTL